MTTNAKIILIAVFFSVFSIHSMKNKVENIKNTKTEETHAVWYNCSKCGCNTGGKDDEGYYELPNLKRFCLWCYNEEFLLPKYKNQRLMKKD